METNCWAKLKWTEYNRESTIPTITATTAMATKATIIKTKQTKSRSRPITNSTLHFSHFYTHKHAADNKYQFLIEE